MAVKPVYIAGSNIVSPLGITTAENFEALCNDKTGVAFHNDPSKSDIPFYASLFEDTFFSQRNESLSKFEFILSQSIKDVVTTTNIDVSDPKTTLIISSTKGNISFIETKPINDDVKEEVGLTQAAKKLAAFLGFTTSPIVVSHACISGLLALITAKRLLNAGKYENVVVAGADIITRFILSGFQAFHAVSDTFCKPFDADRSGINLGEAAATIVLSVHPPENVLSIQLTGGAVSNDANHISGSSRTGEELFQAIDASIKEAGISNNKIDFISAHGTATLYNDDMESKAINLAGLQHIPVNSLKGFYGHTLGAGGLLETAISIECLLQNTIIPTKGFAKSGTVKNINVCSTLQAVPLQVCLKTASGFGGCNASVILEKKKI